MPSLERITIQAYRGGRYKDVTESRSEIRRVNGVPTRFYKALSLQEIYLLVLAGHTLSVTDRDTGNDVTSKTLVELILQNCPDKFAHLPPSELIAIVRK